MRFGVSVQILRRADRRRRSGEPAPYRAIKFSAAFAVFAPIEQGRGGVAFARNGVRNMCVAEPRQGRKLKYVVAERAGKVFSLLFGGFSGSGDVFARGGKERHAHYLEQFRLPVEPGESRVDLVEQNYLPVQKAVAEFLDFVRAFCRDIDERKGKGVLVLTNVP